MDKKISCKKCNSKLIYLRIKKRERVCRTCGYIEKLKTKGEQDAEPQLEGSADASNKAPDEDILNGVIDSTKDGKKAEIGVKNELDDGSEKG